MLHRLTGLFIGLGAQHRDYDAKHAELRISVNVTERFANT